MSKVKAPTSKTSNRTAPKLERDGENGVAVRFKDAEQIQRLYGMKTKEAARLLMEIGLKAFGQRGLDYLELVPALAVEMEPEHAVEAMLINQMAATHYAISSMSSRFLNASSPELREAYERSLTRLCRTLLAQIEGLKKYQAKAQQTVRGERVIVNDGGQAVVGHVERGSGEK